MAEAAGPPPRVRGGRAGLAPLPRFAGFVHTGVRAGYETVWFRDRSQGASGAGVVLEGGAAAVEDDAAWSVQYRIHVDDRWRTTAVDAVSITDAGSHRVRAEVHEGRWWVDGARRRDLDGCVDVDLEASLATNTLALHRLDLSSPTAVDVPAAFVRADDLRVERLEQRYRCTARDHELIAVAYDSSTFGVALTLTFDGAGLVVDYPGLGHRHR